MDVFMYVYVYVCVKKQHYTEGLRDMISGTSCATQPVQSSYKRLIDVTQNESADQRSPFDKH